MMFNRLTAFLLTLSVVLAGGIASGHEGATGIIKVRMDTMEDLGDHLKVLVGMTKGEIAFNQQKVAATAAAMAEIADRIPDMFPSDSLHPPSEATAAIWSDWSKFKVEAGALSIRATELEVGAGSLANASDLQVPVVAIGETCKTCHESYRIKK